MDDSIIEEWDVFFSNLTSFLRDCERSWDTVDANKVSFVFECLEKYVRTLNRLCEHCQLILSHQSDEEVDLNTCLELSQMLHKLCDILCSTWLPYWYKRIEECEAIELATSAVHNSLEKHVSCLHTGKKGRPKLLLNHEQLLFLKELNFSWKDISHLYGVSRMTLYRRRCELQINSKFSDISDSDLIDKIQQIKRSLPECGERMVIGKLVAEGVVVQRHRIRNIIHYIDPIGPSLRWAPCIKRRPYSVPGSNALWHLDGNHKLIHWNMVIHGGIDGFSRLIVYLHCANNNKAQTVLSCFRDAIKAFGFPKKIRTDRGGENQSVARLMLEVVGENSVLTGSSVHNQRIERLWRDLNVAVTRVFASLFYQMENNGILNRDNQKHLLALHYVFIPKINATLKSFQESWNNHKLSSTNKSPLQMFTSSRLAHSDFYDEEVDPTTYGIDEEGPISCDNDLEQVNVPDLGIELNHICNVPIQTDDNMDPIDMYNLVVESIL